MSQDTASPVATARIVFMPSGKRGEFPIGTTIIDAARKLGVVIQSVCGGRAICGRCQIEPASGHFAKLNILSSSENLSTPGKAEQHFREMRGLADNRRLSCQVSLTGDMVVVIPEDMNQQPQQVRKKADNRPLPHQPAITLHYVEVAPPTMENPSGDLERLVAAVQEQWQMEVTAWDFTLAKNLQKNLEDGAYNVTVALYQSPQGKYELIGLWPGIKEKIYGLACDIGSTTLAGHLIDLTNGLPVATVGMANPQIRFGEDLMSRVSHVMLHQEGLGELTASVRQAINEILEKLAIEVNIDPGDIVEAVFVGNPVMHHLFLGLDPTPLGGAPFALALTDAQSFPARDLDIAMAQSGKIYTLPCIAGHVGADAAAAILAERLHERTPLTLLVDIGTNAEIILGNKKRLLAASSPTGPAFEGAEISCGQRAAPGAIERLRIDRQTLEPRFKVIGCNLWSDEDGFQQAVQDIGVTGLCGSAIIEAVAELFLSGLINKDGRFNETIADTTARLQKNGRSFHYLIHEGAVTVSITQNDIRAIQLAKAALYAGIRLLMDKMNGEAIEEILLAGAFGSIIDPQYAMIIGLIPDCSLDGVHSVGNAAGLGARMALVNTNYRHEIENTVKNIEKIETALEANFQQHFIAAMAFPHQTDSFDNLAQVVSLPILETDNDEQRHSRRKGRKRRK